MDSLPWITIFVTRDAIRLGNDFHSWSLPNRLTRDKKSFHGIHGNSCIILYFLIVRPGFLLLVKQAAEQTVELSGIWHAHMMLL